MNQVKVLIRNVSTNWITLALNIIVFYFLTPYVIEKLGTDVYGIWVLIISVTTFIQLMDFGMAGALRRFISHHEARNENQEIASVISNIFFIYAVVSIIVVIGVLLTYFYLLPVFEISPKLADIAKAAFLIAGLDIAFILFFNLYAGTLWALQRFDITNYGLIASIILRTIIIVLMLNVGMGLVDMALAIFFTNLLYHLYKMIAVHNVYPEFKISLGLISKTKMISLSKFSGIGFLTSLSNLGIRHSSPILIGIFLNSISVAYFVISQSLVNYASQIIGAASGVTGPAISRQNSLSKHDSNKSLLLNGQRFTAYISYLICLGLILFGDKFIELWVGLEFSTNAYHVLVLLAFAAMLSLPQSIAHNFLFNTNKHLLNAQITLALFVGSTILQVLLVSYAQLEGIALGFLLAHAFMYLIIIPKVIVKSINVSYWTYITLIYIKPLVISLPMIISALMIRYFLDIESMTNLLMLASISALLHLLTIYTLGVNVEERAAFKLLIKNRETV
ncbi:MAG: O-antigen/teichoic acid export membrane protein [Colwellia sp.]|jgi:O-antigen/teichoic acid export membrane protein